MTTTVHLDKPLRQLDPADEYDWEDWLLRHHLNADEMACPSELVWNPKSKTLTVQLFTYDKTSRMRQTKRIKCEQPPVPFPGGYRVEEVLP